MIDRETIDRIYAAADIVDVISDYVTLKRKGVNYQACCPFHNEKTPSFVVSPAKGLFRCFGCGKGGNAVTFVMQHESMSYPEALKSVAKKYGIEVAERELTQEEQHRNDDRESMYALNGWAYDYFINYLSQSQEGRSVGMSYFAQARGFSQSTIEKFGLGFCPAKGDTMSAAALAAGYKRDFLLGTGLSLERESDKSLYDRFRDRVIFPVHNISGRIVAFGGRTLRTDKRVAKYQNSPESEIYSKRRELYGLFFAKRAIQQHDVVIMVEGYTDVISMHQAGIENVVSSSGTSLTIEQVRLLKRFTKNITIIYDGDAAGVKAAIRGIDLVLKEDMNVRIVSLPVEHDPDSFARAHTAAQVQEYVRLHEEDFITFKAKLLLGEAGGDPIKRAEMITDMVTSISQIPEPIRRSVFAKECSKIMDIDESILTSEIVRKVAMGIGGAESQEFIRNQSRQMQRQESAAPPDDLFVDDSYGVEERSTEVGSSVAALEFELLRYLLRYGHRGIEIVSGSDVMRYNIAQLIYSEFEGEIQFLDSTNQQMVDLYYSDWGERQGRIDSYGEGEEVSSSLFLTSDSADVCNRAVEIMMWGDRYEASALWHLRDKRVDSLDTLSQGVPKCITLYKWKSTEARISILQESLADADSTHVMDLIQELSHLNAIKVEYAKHLKRLII